MKKSKLSILALCLILSLANAQLAFADGENSEAMKSFRPRIATPLRSIGTVESIGALKIDGRMAKGQELLWGSELIQAPENASARIALNSIGQLSLNPSSAIRVTTIAASTQNNQPTLIASLVKGSMNVKLQNNATAYLTYEQTSFIASDGASFSFEAKEEKAFVNATSGNIARLGQWTINIPLPVLLEAERLIRMQEQTKVRRYLIKPYKLGITTDVRARSSRQIQVRVTDENDKPVPDLPIVFSLKENIGQLSVNGLTNAQGIATATFTANTAFGASSLYTVSIPGTAASFTGSITIISAGFWTLATALPVLATVGAATAVGASVVATKDKPQPVSQSLPAPVIKP